jgi:pimeloyl-ACP methyl ester carboxylesterase
MKYIPILFILSISFSCQKEKIAFSTNAHDTFFLQAKGNAMPIQVYGNTASKTFLLIVHGGPGGTALVYRDAVIKNTIEKDFAVVYWDQRYGWAAQGNTELNQPEYEDVVSDMEKVVGILQQRYGRDISLFVNGHSWGGFLTPYYLVKGNNQKNVKGWIHSNGAHDIPLLNKLLIEKFLQKASVEIAANRNVSKWTEIKNYANSITLPATPEQTLKLNEYASKAEDLTPEVLSPLGVRTTIDTYTNNNGPITSALISLIRSKESYNNAMFSKLSRGTDLSDKLPLIKVPSLILFGEWDFKCPPKLGDAVASKISSSYIKKINYPNSGHTPMIGTDGVNYWADVKDFMIKFK